MKYEIPKIDIYILQNEDIITNSDILSNGGIGNDEEIDIEKIQ